CGFFPWRKVDFKPSVTRPEILVGQLPDTDFRCVHTSWGDELTSTDFYIVIEEGGQRDPLFRLDLSKVDDYFAYAYRFTVKVSKHRSCHTGTESVDRVNRQARRTNHQHWAAQRRQSLKAEEAITLADVKITCVDTIRELQVQQSGETGIQFAANVEVDSSCPAIDDLRYTATPAGLAPTIGNHR
ncbi:MAG TPA: hypothetical protein VGJ82_08395, partial [Thermoanaerobaculia bacterium]